MNKLSAIAAFAALAVVSANAGHSNPAAGQPVPAPSPSPGAGPRLSLSLAQALQLALANNLTYRSVIADEKIARAKVIQAGAGRNPSVAADYQYIHTQSAGFFAFPAPGPSPRITTFPTSATNINNLNATLQYAVYTGGAVQAAVGEAAAGLSAAESNLAAARADVLRDTISAYFSLLSALNVAAIDATAVQVAQQNLAVTQQQYNAGTLAKADVLRGQVSVANARVQSIEANADAALANAKLANLLNINLGSQITPTEPLAIVPPSFALNDMLNDAQAKRPEIAAAHDAVVIAAHAVRGARAGYLPNVSLQLQEASSKPNFFNVPQPQLSETLAVTWKLFDGGLTRGKVVEAEADLDKARIQLAQLDNSVDLEVRQAYLTYQAALAQVAAAKSAQASADESLRVTTIRYRAGVGTSLELADAELADTQARTQVVSALVNLRVALANLQRAAGIL